MPDQEASKGIAQTIVDTWLGGSGAKRETPNPSGVTASATAEATGVGNVRQARGRIASKKRETYDADRKIAQSGVEMLLSQGQEAKAPEPVEPPSPSEQAMGPSLTLQTQGGQFSGMPDTVRRGLLNRTAMAAVPKHLQDPANWPDDYKKKLLDPASVEAQMHVYDEGKYGMPTFGYVSDPERKGREKQARLENEPGNVYSAAKAMDWHLQNAGVDLPDDVRQAAIGYMWLKNGLKSDADKIPPSTGTDLAQQLSDPSKWPAFKQKVAQMKQEAEDLASKPELAFLKPDVRGTTQTQARQQDPTTVEGQMAAWDMAHYGKLTFGQNPTPERTAHLKKVVAAMGDDGKLSPGAAGMLAESDSPTTFGDDRSNKQNPWFGEQGDYLPSSELKTQGDSAVRTPHEAKNALGQAVGGLGEIGKLSLYAAHRLGIVPLVDANGIVVPNARDMPEKDFLEAYKGSVQGTVGSIAAEFAPYAIPGIGQAAFGGDVLQKTIQGGLPAAWEMTGVPGALKVMDDPASTWQDRTHAVSALATAGLMLFHAGVKTAGAAGRGANIVRNMLAPVDLPVDALKPAWLSLPPDVLKEAVRIRSEMADALQQSGATDPAKLDGHATAAAITLARAAQNIHGKGGVSAPDLLAKVQYTFDAGLNVPPEIAAELAKVSVNAGDPKAALGPTTIFTRNLGNVQAEHKVVSLADLVASHRHDTFEENPAYPHDREYQGRDRMDETAQAQVRTIGSKPRIDELTADMHSTDRASPVVLADGTVVSGNGRVMGLRRMTGETKQAYHDAVREIAGDAANGIADPVLVRELPKSMSEADVKTFADEANRSQTLRMGTTESAYGAAKSLPNDFWQSLKPHGDSFMDAVDHQSNRFLVNRFLQSFPLEERAAMLTDGVLNRRGKDALLEAATADLLGPGGKRFMDSLSRDEESGRLEHGLVQAMPELLKSKSPELADALNAMFDEYHRFKQFQKSKKTSWEEYKAQGRLEHVAPELVDAFHALGDAVTKGGSAGKVADALREMVSGGKFKEIADALAGQDPLFSSERKDPFIVVKNVVPGFARLIEEHGGKSLGEDYYALKNDSNARMLTEQAGVQVDPGRTRSYNKRYAEQSGLFGEEQAVKEPSAPEPTQDSLFSKGTSREGETITNLASIHFNDDGSALIQLGKGATVAEVAHETAHYLETALPPEMLKSVSDALGFKGEWTTRNKERFARAFELYLTDKASVPGADPVMARLANAVKDVYENQRQGDLQFQAEPHIGEGRLEVPNALKSIFDDMTKHPETWPGMTAQVQQKDNGTVEQPADISGDTPGDVAPEQGVPRQARGGKPKEAEPPDVADNAPVAENRSEASPGAPMREARGAGKPAEVSQPEHNPFEDIPEAVGLSEKYHPVRDSLTEQGFDPAHSEKIVKGMFGTKADQQAVLDDPAVVAEIGRVTKLPTDNETILRTWLELIGKEEAAKAGLSVLSERPTHPYYSDVDAVPTDVSQMRGVEPKRKPRGKKGLSSTERRIQDEDRFGPGFRMKSLDVIKEKMNGAMGKDAILAMLRNNGVKASELEAMERVAPAMEKLTPEQAAQWSRNAADNSYSEHKMELPVAENLPPEKRAEYDKIEKDIAEIEAQRKPIIEKIVPLKKQAVEALKAHVKESGAEERAREYENHRRQAYEVIKRNDDLGFDNTYQAWNALYQDAHIGRSSTGDFELTPAEVRILNDALKSASDHWMAKLMADAARDGQYDSSVTKMVAPELYDQIRKLDDEGRVLNQRLKELVDAQTEITYAHKPVYGQYSIKPKGENYRELIAEAPGYGFSPSHFQRPNYDFHVRASDRIIDGKNTTFIEEVQSDRHQAARDKGYHSQSEIEELHADLIGAKQRLQSADVNRERLIAERGKPGYDPAEADAAEHEYAEAKRLEREAAIKVQNTYDSTERTPTFKNWEEIAMKRAFLDAVNRGHDQVAWTKGEVHSDRYYEDETGTQFDSEPGAVERNARRARGFQAAYDERLVNIANNIGKKYGVRAEQTTVEGKPAWKMEIPDDLKLDYMEKGPYLFSSERRIPGLQEEKLDQDIADVLGAAKDEPGWKESVQGVRAKLKKVAGGVAPATQGVVSVLRHHGEAGKRAAARIYNAWAHGRNLSVTWRHKLLDAMDEIYGIGRVKKNLGFGLHSAEVADTAHAVLTRWDPKERDKVLAMAPGAFEDWLKLAGEAKGMKGADGPPPTLNQIKLWATWGRLAQETSDTAWASGVGTVRTVDADLPSYEAKLRGQEVQYVVGGGGKDAPGVMQTGRWLGFDEGTNTAYVLGPDSKAVKLVQGDMFVSKPLIEGMDFFPRKFKDSVLKELQNPDSPMYAQALAAKMKSGMTVSQAKAAIEAVVNGQPVATPGRSLTRIERPRLPSDFPPEFYDWDFLAVAEHHLDSVAKRTAQASAFGRDMSDLATDFAEAAKGNKKLLDEWATGVQAAFGHNRSTGDHAEAVRDVLSLYGALKVITALGTGKTAVKQIGSLASVASQHGFGPALHGLVSALSPNWYKTVERLGGLDSDFTQWHGIDTEGKAKRAATATLKWTGVTFVDKMTRVIGADAGIVATKLAVNRIAKLSNEKFKEGNLDYDYLTDWQKFSHEDVVNMADRARANNGRFNFTLDGMEPMHTIAQFGGVRSVGIVDPIEFPSYITQHPALKGLFTLNHFNKLQTNIVGYGINEAARGNFLPLARLAIAGTLVGNAVVAGIQKLEKEKQFAFWFQWHKHHDGMTDEQAKTAAADSSASRSEQPGFHYATDVKLNDTDVGQIASVLADGLTASGVLGFYNGIVDQSTRSDDPYAETSWDKSQRVLAGLAPAPLSDIVKPVAAIASAQEKESREKDRALRGETVQNPTNVGAEAARTMAGGIGLPVIGTGPARKPQAWKVAMDELKGEAGLLVRKFSAYPNPQKWKGETDETFLARVRAQAVNWNNALNNLQGFKGDDLRARVLQATQAAFRKPRG